MFRKPSRAERPFSTTGRRAIFRSAGTKSIRALFRFLDLSEEIPFFLNVNQDKMRLMKNSNAFFFLLLTVFSLNLFAQTPAETHQKILQAVESRDYQTAASELEALKKTDEKIFGLNNYDYL